MQKKEECIMKNKKRIFAFALAACLLLSMAACGNDSQKETNNLPEGVSYGIKVVDGEGNPIAGALVSLCQEGEGGTCYMPSTTGSDGMALFYENMVPVQNHLKVRVLSAEGYILPVDGDGEILYTPIPDGQVHIILVLQKA